MDDVKEIRKHIERSVTWLAREHQATDEVVWKQMLIAATEHTGINKIETI